MKCYFWLIGCWHPSVQDVLTAHDQWILKKQLSGLKQANYQMTNELETETREAERWLESKQKFEEIASRYKELFKKTRIKR